MVLILKKKRKSILYQFNIPMKLNEEIM